MNVFPIGSLTDTSSSTGTRGLLWEPNAGCLRRPIYTTLVSKTEANTQVTRKKAEVYHTFTYTYENIWTKEYVQIEKFFKDMYGKLTSFSLVDFSHMQPCIMAGTDTRTMTKGGTISSLDTSFFTTTSGEGGNYCCVWSPSTSKFKIGVVASISASTNVTFDNTAGTTIGDLASGSIGLVLCPVYTVYFTDDQLNFEIGEFNPDETDDQGYVYSGSISFIQSGVN